MWCEENETGVDERARNVRFAAQEWNGHYIPKLPETFTSLHTAKLGNKEIENWKRNHTEKCLTNNSIPFLWTLRETWLVRVNLDGNLTRCEIKCNAREGTLKINETPTFVWRIKLFLVQLVALNQSAEFPKVKEDERERRGVKVKSKINYGTYSSKGRRPASICCLMKWSKFTRLFWIVKSESGESE